MSTRVDEIDLHLRDIRNFFQVPEIDPFIGENTDIPGIEQLLDTLKARGSWRKGALKTRLHLPSNAHEDALVARMRPALAGYCDRQIQQCERKINEVRIEGRRGLRVGAIFLAACMGAAAIVEALIGSERMTGKLLAEGLIIAGWVGLWHPIELLLYEWWPYSRDIKLYGKIRDMDLDVRFDGAEA